MSYKDVYSVIKNMNTRGAPAIGVAAAYGMALAGREALTAPQPEQFVRDAGAYLKSARPTAVNLAWAVDRSLGDGAPSLGKDPRAVADELARIRGASLPRMTRIRISPCRSTVPSCFEDGDTIMTICNTGALATYRYGTAFGSINEAFKQGKKIQVIALETRPVSSGSAPDCPGTCEGRYPLSPHHRRDGRLHDVAWEGDQGYRGRGPHRLERRLCQQDRDIPAGCPGEVPRTAVLQCGAIEFLRSSRLPQEQRSRSKSATKTRSCRFAGRRVAAEGAHAFNPSFDVTPNELLSGIVTERGVFRHPFGNWERP